MPSSELSHRVLRPQLGAHAKPQLMPAQDCRNTGTYLTLYRVPFLKNKPVMAFLHGNTADIPLGKYLRVSVKTIYKWRLTNDGPPAARVGKHLRYDPADVVAWRKSMMIAA